MDEPLATNPAAVLAPGAREAAWGGAVTVIVVPFCSNVPFQPLPIVTPDGTVKVTTHGLTVAPPMFWTTTAPWNPVGQLFVTVTPPAQEPGPG